MKAILLVLFSLIALSVASLDDDFAQYVKDYGKVYASEEEYNQRKENYARKVSSIKSLSVSNPYATFAVNKFSDLSEDEFASMYLMPTFEPTHVNDENTLTVLENVNVPSSFDWRLVNPTPITPVKDQGQCGSCWAFSATEEIESSWILAGHNQTILAPQQIVDCDTKDLGCDGGDTPTAYAYVMSAGGLELETVYPYTAKDGKCHGTGPFAASLTSWKYANSKKNETQLLTALATVAPISICLDAASWDSYKSGVLTKCGNKLDHCVQLVGYGTDSTSNLDYWIVRNSWGTSWGETGYIRLERGKNLCGLADEATISTSA